MEWKFFVPTQNKIVVKLFNTALLPPNKDVNKGRRSEQSIGGSEQSNDVGEHHEHKCFIYLCVPM